MFLSRCISGSQYIGRHYANRSSFALLLHVVLVCQAKRFSFTFPGTRVSDTTDGYQSAVSGNDDLRQSEHEAISL
eukprot:TRINITY_DN2405_c0_g1_i1.p1 TRINITY_DN2405_c0_g1~~TRINITY_DN2405_c0_g1_i1.p1  ORF type:complete len:75 (+),score=3.43 TRINITY_DN2405_c0_g1_i1:35-259(+)